MIAEKRERELVNENGCWYHGKKLLRGRVYFDQLYSARELSFCQVKKARKGLEDWKAIKMPGVGKIERVVAYFEVWAAGVFPSAKVKIKILESPTGLYTGFPNMAAKSRQDRSPDWIAGFGKSISEALEDTIKQLLKSIAENEALSEEDFEWSAPEDF